MKDCLSIITFINWLFAYIFLENQSSFIIVALFSLFTFCHCLYFSRSNFFTRLLPLPSEGALTTHYVAQNWGRIYVTSSSSHFLTSFSVIIRRVTMLSCLFLVSPIKIIPCWVVIQITVPFGTKSLFSKSNRTFSEN